MVIYDSLLTHRLSRAKALSLAVAGWMAAASLAGLLLPDRLYPSVELRGAFLANDLVNLLVGLPALLGAWQLVRRQNLLGLLGLPGALLYVIYNSIAYAAAMPFTWLFLVHGGLVGLSGLAILLLGTSIEGEVVQSRLQGRVAERLGGGVLLGMGGLFFLRAAAILWHGPAGMAEFGVLAADILTTPLWMVGGLLLWRRKPLGYVSGVGLLFQASMLFVGLLVFLILQPWVAGVPFLWVDWVVVLAMGMVCFIPFGWFVSGVWRAERDG